MQSLELKIPPPLVAVLLAAAMWGVSTMEPTVALPLTLRRVIAAVVALTGGAFDVLGLLAFRKSGTTINPLKPQNTTTFVTRGVYRFTRNPMYVGLACFLTAWAVLLPSVWPLLGPVLFVLYMNRFQIEPEERILSCLFGEAYAAYTQRVRRWL